MNGCTSLSKPITVERVTSNVSIYNPPMPDGIKWNKITWEVWNTKILIEKLCKKNGNCIKQMKDLISSTNDGRIPVIVIHGLSPNGYKVLTGNMGEVKRVLKGNRKQFIYYRDVGKKKPQQN
jgi:hypothetical protein